MAAARLHAKEDRRDFPGERVDKTFLILTLLLLAIGLIMLWSASAAQSMYDTGYQISTKYLQKQAVCAVLGLGCMYLFSRIPASFWLKAAWPLYGISIAMLLLVLVAGESVNGARRWINIAGLQFQPSEIAKFTMIVLFAKLTKSFGTETHKFRYGVLGFGAALLGILIPLALEKHLSAILLMGMVAVVIMFVAGTSSKWLLAGAGAAVAFVVLYVSLWAMPVIASRRGCTRRVTPPIPAIRYCSPFMPSARADCSAWALARADRSISICPFSIMTTSSRSFVRSWV